MLDLPRAPRVRPSFQVGSVFDIPSGMYIQGRRGESILNSGITSVNSVSGPGNSFKTEIVIYFLMTAMARYGCATANWYDTENTMSYERLERAATRFGIRDVEALFDLENPRVALTQAADIIGDKWFDKIKEYGRGRARNAKTLLTETPFKNERDPKKGLEILRPTFVIIDSLSEFKVDSVQSKLVDKNAVGESGANTQFMKEGAAKTQLITQLPNLSAQGGLYFFQVAHIGDRIDLDQYAPKPNSLTFSKKGKKNKGVPEKFTFINNTSYEIYDASFSRNSSSDKSAKYPKREADRNDNNKDLMEVVMVTTRNKSGPSGVAFTVFISQSEGLLPNLTMFQYLIDYGDYGLIVNGNRSTYRCVFYPDVPMSRTTVRGLLDSDYKLSRAIEIACQMRQMEMLWSDLDPELHCDPETLYNDIKALGYDWDILLDTRSYWVFIEDEGKEKPFLSTMDLLRMRKGLYRPFWYDKVAKAKNKK